MSGLVREIESIASASLPSAEFVLDNVLNEVAMAQRDLKLNSLGKYGKGSSRLILEEHGHCEVPAGCGGAVLRWRNPKSGLLFIIKVFATAKYQILLDGDAPSSGRPLVSFGEHVISLVVTEIGPNPAVVAIAAVHDESQSGFPRVSQPSGARSRSFPPVTGHGNTPLTNRSTMHGCAPGLTTPIGRR